VGSSVPENPPQLGKIKNLLSLHATKIAISYWLLAIENNNFGIDDLVPDTHYNRQQLFVNSYSSPMALV
jgi:hypothetical protein